ncbi:MAG: ElyC/SanA/YdcF family protein [Eubacteriales bacterium]
MKKKIIKLVKFIFWLSLVIIVLASSINIYMVQYAKKHIVQRDTYYGETVDCVIVLGASARTGKPSLMLKDRLDLAYELYRDGYVRKILVSGDHMYKDYDEVNVMKSYLMDLGVVEEDIFMDHAGADTYTTMKRAKEVFMVDSCIISTQKYHLYRAVYIANQMDMDATGIACDVFISSKLWYFKSREFLARFKDFFYVNVLKPSVILGETIPISGDGRATEDGLT